MNRISAHTSSKIIARGGLVLLGILILVFIIYPPLRLFESGREVFSSSGGWNPSVFFRAFGHSLQLGIEVFCWTTLIGGVLAWLTVKTDFPLSKWVDRISLLIFCIPPYVLAISWFQLAGRNGYLQRFLHWVYPASEWIGNPYSLSAAALVLSIHLFPLVYLSMKNALLKIPVERELAAALSGASPARQILTITLPQILPSLAATGLLVFSRAMANFSVPALLCLPANIEVVTTGIYSALSGFRTGEASFYSLVLVVFTTSLALMQSGRRDLGIGKGIGRAAARIPLGSTKWFLVVVIGVFLFVAGVIPLVTMGISSFLKRWGLPLASGSFTLNNYRILFSDPQILRAFRNSLVYGGSAALIASIVGGGSALFYYFMPSKWTRGIRGAASWPMAIPNTVLAVAAVYAWNRPPLRLYGTPWALIITYAVLFTPIIQKQVIGLLELTDRSRQAAAAVCGAGPWRRFFGILLPEIAGGFRTGILLCIMIALREIPISLMLYSSGQETVGVVLFGMQSQSYGLEMTSTISLFLILLLLLGNRLGRKRRAYGQA